MIDNPWQKLPDQPPYVLPDEASLIREFNSSSDEKYQIRLEVFPEPFLGRPDAPLVLLGLNPGFKEWDITNHQQRLFAQRSRFNLLHETSDYPFYLLAPDIERTKYWERKLRRLIERFGAEHIAHHVFCVEYLGYHSCRFKHSKLSLPSQQYSFWLVGEAIKRNAVILLLRGGKFWLNAVSELKTYERLYRPNSPQNPSVTQRNFPEGFPAAIEALDRSKRFVEDFSEGGVSISAPT